MGTLTGQEGFLRQQVFSLGHAFQVEVSWQLSPAAPQHITAQCWSHPAPCSPRCTSTQPKYRAKCAARPPAHLHSASTRSPWLLSPACACCQKPGSSGTTRLPSPAAAATCVLHKGIRRSGAPFTYITRLPSGSACIVAMNCTQQQRQGTGSRAGDMTIFRRCAGRAAAWLVRFQLRSVLTTKTLIDNSPFSILCQPLLAASCHLVQCPPCARSQRGWPRCVAWPLPGPPAAGPPSGPVSAGTPQSGHPGACTVSCLRVTHAHSKQFRACSCEVPRFTCACLGLTSCTDRHVASTSSML